MKLNLTLAVATIILLHLIQAVDLELDESSFTGETQSCSKNVQEMSSQTPFDVARCSNIAFMGTLVRSGRGIVSTIDDQICYCNNIYKSKM